MGLDACWSRPLLSTTPRTPVPRHACLQAASRSESLRQAASVTGRGAGGRAGAAVGAAVAVAVAVGAVVCAVLVRRRRAREALAAKAAQQEAGVAMGMYPSMSGGDDPLAPPGPGHRGLWFYEQLHASLVRPGLRTWRGAPMSPSRKYQYLSMQGQTCCGGGISE